MNIEIEDIKFNENGTSFWETKGGRKITGGDIKITLDTGKNFEFDIQSFAFYVISRSYGKGFTKNK